MIGAILMQSSKSDGIGAGFGALGGSQVFGGRGASDFLKKFTTITAIAYAALVIMLSYSYRGGTSDIGSNPLLDNSQGSTNTIPATESLSIPQEQNNTTTKTDSAK